ncbi:MAG TPA: quinone-dependent dihydroorotate dehydrogenase [Ktedonobacterales bacterium]|jgi:dihydroorotate dehydrogenase
MLYQRAIRPLLFARGRDPERIHDEVLGLLAWVARDATLTGALARATGAARPDPRLAREVFGLRFPTPIGLAAGFDKNGIAAPALAALGFGFIEIGTITRHAQPGNPRPRLLRLPADGALINRMGFNNAGAAAVAERLARLPRPPVPLGISLGKSKITPLEDAPADYLASLDLLHPYADYFAINVSSPNTPGLRALQDGDRLDALLAALVERLRERAAAAGRARPKPMLVKLSPDLADDALAALVEVCLARGVDGLIATNTTLAREGLRAPTAEEGGLSGRPLAVRTLRVVRRLRALAGDRLPIIGCGGLATPADARALLDAGATLLQLYTSFIYEGPGIARRLARALS